jgi:hypothetical protein
VKTPVALLFFNRPEPLARVFERVRQARPEKLLLVADGPRASRPQEAEACERARAVAQAVDWPCEVLTNFSAENLGCKRRIASGLDWVFQQVEEAILLEDDCLPDLSFFRFAEEMLERYRGDERIMAISGSRYFASSLEPEASYYFSRYAHIWGWATWRRTWAHYDVNIAGWPQWKAQGGLRRRFPRLLEAWYWSLKLDRVYRGLVDTWDYQWSLAGWMRDGLCVIPAKNLVQNIGFDAAATHTLSASSSWMQAAESLDFPLRHPRQVAADHEVEARTWRQNFRPDPWTWLKGRWRA